MPSELHLCLHPGPRRAISGRPPPSRLVNRMLLIAALLSMLCPPSPPRTPLGRHRSAAPKSRGKSAIAEPAMSAWPPWQGCDQECIFEIGAASGSIPRDGSRRSIRRPVTAAHMGRSTGQSQRFRFGCQGWRCACYPPGWRLRPGGSARWPRCRVRLITPQTAEAILKLPATATPQRWG